MNAPFFGGRVRRIHFVGIGGIGMSGIAEVLVNLGFEVSGSDLADNDNVRRLAAQGVQITRGHQARQVRGADVVVTSSAIPALNPEVIAAHDLHIPVIPRAEMLAELMRMKIGVAVAGSHGKTTTTSLLAAALSASELDPTLVIGGRLNTLGSNARLGKGPYLVAEADESDGSFLRLSPTVAVITNIDPEHLDHWTGGLDAIQDAFVEFAGKVPFYGLVVLCADHPGVRAVLPRIERRTLRYGLSPQAQLRARDIRAQGLQTTFVVELEGAALGEVELRLAGEHNVLNCLAAIAVALELGVDMPSIVEGLCSFAGVGRRFEILGEVGGITIVDDYGHHPVEIGAVLSTARQVFSGRRLVVAFQPHRYSRTRDLFDSFVTCFDEADLLLVTDIYAASEDPIDGVSGASLAAAIGEMGHRDCRHAPQEALAEQLRAELRSGDVVLSLGAGNIWQLGHALLETLRRQAGGEP